MFNRYLHQTKQLVVGAGLIVGFLTTVGCGGKAIIDTDQDDAPGGGFVEFEIGDTELVADCEPSATPNLNGTIDLRLRNLTNSDLVVTDAPRGTINNGGETTTTFELQLSLPLTVEAGDTVTLPAPVAGSFAGTGVCGLCGDVEVTVFVEYLIGDSKAELGDVSMDSSLICAL